MIAYFRRRPSRVEAPRVGRDRLQRFFDGIEKTGNWIAAAKLAGVDHHLLKGLREADVTFDRRVIQAIHQSLEQKSAQLAIEGILEPVVVDGKIPRDDEGNPIGVRRYSNSLLLALLRAENPERFAVPTKALHPAWVQWLFWTFLAVIAVWAIGDLTLRYLALGTGHPHG